MKQIIFLMCLMFVLVSCGQKVDHSAKEASIANASKMMDAGDFEAAITVLESVHHSNPDDMDISIKLLHAYSGAGSFEALKVAQIWKDIQEELQVIKNEEKAKLDKSVLKSADNLVANLEKTLKPIPELSEKQLQRLDQAIDLYNELGMTVETAGKYNNFKWGALHVYRLAINVKSVVSAVRKNTSEGDKLNLKAIEAVVMPKLKIMGRDLFLAYKLYSNSFDKIKKITDSIDKLIGKTIKDENFKLKISTIAKDEGEFYKSLINDNIKASSVLLSKLSDIYHNNGHKDKVKDLVGKLPSEEELKETQKRIEGLVKVFIDQFREDHPEVESKLKSIFTEQLKIDVLESIKLSLKARNTDPLKELLESKRPEMEVIKSYYLILKGEFEESSLEEDLKAEVNALKSKVDLEMLKIELKEIAEALRQDSKVVELGADAIMHQNKEKLEARKVKLEADIKKITDDLDCITDELKENIKAEDPDKETEEQIHQEVKTFVENEE